MFCIYKKSLASRCDPILTSRDHRWLLAQVTQSGSEGLPCAEAESVTLLYRKSHGQIEKLKYHSESVYNHPKPLQYTWKRLRNYPEAF